MLDLAFSEEQDLLWKSAREFFEQECPYTLLHEVEKTDEGYSDELWRKMAALGWMGLPFPSAYGGEDGTPVEMGVLMGEFGRSGCASPYFSTTALGGGLLLKGGSEEQKKELLPKIAKGELRVALAAAGPGARVALTDVPFQAEPSKDGWKLSGNSFPVEWGHVADLLLCVARTGDGITVFIVNPKDAGVRTDLIEIVDNDRAARVELDGVQVSRADMVGPEGDGWALLEETLDLANALRCAEMVGGAQKAVEMTVEYASTRIAFGKPTGTFQAVQHQTADAATITDAAWLATYKALSTIAAGVPAEAEAAMARVITRDAFLKAVSVASQIHGGIGHMKEFHLQFYFRRAKGSELRMGSLYDNLEKVASTALGL
jgi:alkylation response protein AidB-like acyl-CoA dehydrogenase